MTERLNLDEAREIATKLSLRQWNQYFFIIPDGTESYKVERYFNSEAKEYYLRGKKFDCS